MRHKTFIALLVAAFVLLMIPVLFAGSLSGIFSSVMAFPFEQIGALLRALSLSGSIGNGAAAALLAALCTAPVAFAFCKRRHKATAFEKAALCVFAAVLALVLVAMANPSRLVLVFPDSTAQMLPIAKGVMGCLAWSFAVLCLVLRLSGLFVAGGIKELSTYLCKVLYGLCFVFVGVIALSFGKDFMAAIVAKQRVMDGFMAVLRFVLSALPYVLDIAITLSLITMIKSFAAEDSESAAKCAQRLSKLSCVAIGLSAAATAAVNAVQVAFAKRLSNIAVSVDIPVVSIAFALLVLLLARLVVENGKLKADNDLFI